MKIHSNPPSDVIILKRGEELITTLNDYVNKTGITSAWLVSGVGGSSQMTLSFYDLETKQYLDRDFNAAFEILSLQGNLSLLDGQPRWHVHGVFSGRDYQTIGGHVQSLTIGLTGELFVTPHTDTQLTRSFDDFTGLTLLD